MNAADVLLRYFDPEKSVNMRFPDLLNAYSSVSGFLQTEAARGNEEAAIANDSMPRLWGFVKDQYVDENGPAFSGEYDFPQECKLALMEARRLMNEGSPKYDETTRKSIQSLIKGIPKELNSLSLPKELNLYILRLTSEVRTALDEYDITGDFKLDDAFSRLQKSLFNVAFSTAEGKKRNGFICFLQDKLTPCLTVLCLGLSVGNQALTMTQVLTHEIEGGAQQTNVSQPRSDTHRSDPWSDSQEIEF